MFTVLYLKCITYRQWTFYACKFYIMEKLKIKFEKPENLIPYVNNNKIHSDEQILRIASSIQEFGFQQPVVVDKNNVIIIGHGRVQAAIKLKLKSVPIVVADHLDEYQVKALRIADNKTSSNEYDIDKLRFDIKSLELKDFNMSSLGIRIDELEDLLKDIDLDIPKMDFLKVEEQKQQKQIESIIKQREDENENIYTDKIATPIYEPKGEKPKLSDLIDLNKYNSLCKEIEKSDLSKEEKEFLMFSASRHIVFNYENIANYYAHSEKKSQELFEKSALVIIDFDKAIENGFVNLSKEINESYIENDKLKD